MPITPTRALLKMPVCLVALAAMASCSDEHSETKSSNAESPEQGAAASMVVTILGSGTPVPNRDQAGAAILVEAGDQILLFDCGRACTTRMAAYNPDLLIEIDKVFLTHLHSDHVVGLPDLWLNGWTQGRSLEFQVWGPDGTASLFEGFQAAFDTDIASRLRPNGPMEAGSLSATVNGLPDEGGFVYSSGELTVTAFPVRHGGMSAYGYLIEHGDQSVMISGDTTATPTLARTGAHADLVLLEVASPAMVDYVRRTFPEAQADAIIGLHLTAGQAGKVMSDIAPDLAVYYHTVASCETDPGLLEATGKTYAGDVKVARDLMQIRLQGDTVSSEYLAQDPADCE